VAAVRLILILAPDRSKKEDPETSTMVSAERLILTSPRVAAERLILTSPRVAAERLILTSPRVAAERLILIPAPG
jgi:hypothetical protein